MKFKPAPWQVPSAEAEAGAPGQRATLPDAPRKKNDLAERRKPVKAVPVPVPPQPSRETPPAAEPPVARAIPVEVPKKLAKGERVMARTISEKERVFIAAGLVSHQGVARLGDGTGVVFRCPVCEEQIHADVSDCDGEYGCPACEAVLHLPAPDGSGKVRVVALPKQKAAAPGLPPLELPDERSADGRSHDARFQAVDELLPDGEEGTLAWGLEKTEIQPVPRRRARAWVIFGVPLVLLAAGFLLRQTLSSAGRATGEATAPAGGALAAPAEGIDWRKLSATRKFLLIEQRLRAYLEAPDIAAKAPLTRGGNEAEAIMSAFYHRTGGYEPETRVYGAVKDVVLRDERTIGGKVFQMVSVRFEQAGGGIYALEQTPTGYLVDWEYAVGYGEVAFPALLANPPAVPVLMRIYLSESLFFSDGFDEREYRSFDMADASRERSIPVFVRRNSPPEDALREAWNNAVLDNIGRSGGSGSSQLDFVVRVRHENEGGRKGFVIDEVLVRGWIVPEDTK